MNKIIAVSLLIISTLLLACLQPSSADSIVWAPPEVVFPENNPLTDANIELGGALFSETLLSKDSTISCASCHLMTSAFADHLPLGEGIKGRHVTRNTPTLMNIGQHPYFMHDGKFHTLEQQVLGPINEHNEFDMSPKEVVSRLRDSPLYHRLSMNAYGDSISIEIVQKAIANFERVIVSENSKFDQYKRGEIELNAQEMKGWELFQSDELKCIQCHGGFNFTNYAFENNGLSKEYDDSGRGFVTRNAKDRAKFKVPTLRNIALTYPYMHDGSIATLDEVIDHYASGGKQHPSQSELIKGFELDADQKEALLAFLNALTEERLLNQE